jgi:hypothetical protein
LEKYLIDKVRTGQVQPILSNGFADVPQQPQPIVPLEFFNVPVHIPFVRTAVLGFSPVTQ